MNLPTKPLNTNVFFMLIRGELCYKGTEEFPALEVSLLEMENSDSNL